MAWTGSGLWLTLSCQEGEKTVPGAIELHLIFCLTKSIASDFVKQNIRCNSIAPGTVFSPSWQDRVNQSPDPVQAKKDFIARQPMGRLGTAEEIAAVAVYLAGDDATFTTGTTISVDGGISI